MNASESRLRDALCRGLSGDDAAYQQFLTELSGFLRAFLRRRLTRFPDDVEDLVQETLLALHNQRHTYDPSQPLTAWVYAIVRYKMVDMLRRHATRGALHQTLDDVPEDEAALFSAPEHEEGDARRDLASLLAQLPDGQRLPIQYMKLEGYSVAETAQRTGLSESAVKVAVHRGLKKLALLIRRNA